MAARAIDDLVEIDMEENVEVVENVSLGVVRGGATSMARSLPLSLPPPPIHRNTYSKVGLMFLLFWKTIGTWLHWHNILLEHADSDLTLSRTSLSPLV